MANIPLSGAGFPYQDYVILQGKQSPGVCTIKGAGTPRNWDERKGYGASGASLIFMGNGLAKFSIEFFLWDRQNHPAQWLDFASVLAKPTPGRPATGLVIVHPLLVFPPLNITQVIVTDVSQPEQSDTGGWTITASFQQYAKPVAVKVKVLPTPDVPNGPPTPKTKEQIELDGKEATLANLQSGSDKSGLF